MRQTAIACLAGAILLTLPADGAAQQRRKLKIERVQVGLPVNPVLGEFKSGFWTPVYVDVSAGPEGLVKGELIVETSDSDDVRNNYRVPLPPLEPNEQLTGLISYTKPSSLHTEIIVTARSPEARLDERKESYTAMQLGDALYLTIGGRLPGLRKALVRQQKPGDDEEIFTRDTGPQHFTALDDVRQMPTRWFGYEAVDLAILVTGNRDFMNALVSDREGRKEALMEWVRRGGRLLVSTGRNQDIVANLDSSFGFLPAATTGQLQVPQIRMGFTLAVADNQILQNPKKTPLDIAKLEPKPGREVDRILPEAVQANEPLLIVRGAYGLGQVTVVAFDLDQQPFTTWSGQSTFWSRLIGPKSTWRIGPVVTEQANPNQPPGFRQYGAQDEDVASQLERNLELFPDVPVISFGWVALFILVYILIVGPLDYFFLKKVVKRLELTWITFPTVVITISVASYFIAYYLKGNDQLINKVDLVDLDVTGQQAYGHSWFTIFSPRIQHYTIGIEPADPGWAQPGAAAQAGSSVLLSWLGRPEMGWGGSGRAHSQSLFRRTYEYAPDATGLIGVPIQVWTTKSFEADWQVPFDPTRPLFQASLRFPAEARTDAKPTGTVTSGLPVELEDVYLVYRGDFYALGRLLPGVPQRVDNALLGTGTKFNDWVTAIPQAAVAGQSAQPTRPGMPMPSEPTATLMKRLEFFDLSTGQAAVRRNNSLRDLDQSWRLRNKDELILVGRVLRKEGPAEEVAMSPATPARLWLGALPRSGQPRPPIPGSLTQETYVRVFLPVRADESR